MRNKSSNLILLTAVLLAGLYIAVSETARFRAARRDKTIKAVFNIIPETVEAIRFTKGENTLLCRRENSRWQIAEPVEAPAATGSIRRILSGLQQQQSATFFDPAAGSGYGFDEGLTIELTDNRGTRIWKIGGKATLHEGIYVLDERRNLIFLADPEITKMLPKNSDSLRERRIFSLGSDALTRVDIRREEGFLQLSLKNGRWHILQPAESAADQAHVADLLEELASARIERFIAEEVSDTTGYGLQPGKYQLTLYSGETESTSLLLGDPLPDNPARIYARYAGGFSIFSVSSNLIGQLSTPTDRLRETRLLPITPADISRIAVSNLTENIELLRNGDAWTLTRPREWQADPEKSAELLRIWYETRTGKFIPIDEKTAPLFEKPEWSIEFTAANKTDRKFIIAAERSADGNLLIRRNSENVAMEVDPAILSTLSHDPLFFKNRTVLAFDPAELSRLNRDVRGEILELTLNDENLYCTTNSHAATVNQSAVSNLVSRLSDLECLRYVNSEGDAAQFGLDAPYIRLAGTLNNEDRLGFMLLIGNELDGGFYGMMQGADPVFILDPELIDAVTGDWIEPND